LDLDVSVSEVDEVGYESPTKLLALFRQGPAEFLAFRPVRADRIAEVVFRPRAGEPEDIGDDVARVNAVHGLQHARRAGVIVHGFRIGGGG
jgi:hypothetical protein